MRRSSATGARSRPPSTTPARCCRHRRASPNSRNPTSHLANGHRDPSQPCRHPPRKRQRSPASSRRRDTDSSAPPACTRSCRTSAWSTTTSTDASKPATSLTTRPHQPHRKETTMEFWTSERRGAVEIATFSNPPRNYIGKPQLDELAQLVAQWRDPAIRAVVIQSRTGENTGFTQYSVEELYVMASDPALSRYAGAVVRGYKAMFDDMMALPKVVIAAMNGDALGGGFELTLACDLRIGQHGDFRYGNPEVRAGVMPGAGGTQRIRSEERRVGKECRVRLWS